MRIKEREAVKGQLPYFVPYGSWTFAQGLLLPLRLHIIAPNISHTQQIKQQYKNDRRSQK